jgi:hypothetical protein
VSSSGCQCKADSKEVQFREANSTLPRIQCMPSSSHSRRFQENSAFASCREEQGGVLSGDGSVPTPPPRCPGRAGGWTEASAARQTVTSAGWRMAAATCVQTSASARRAGGRWTRLGERTMASISGQTSALARRAGGRRTRLSERTAASAWLANRGHVRRSDGDLGG